MLRTRSFDLVNSAPEKISNKVSMLKGSVGADLHALAQDRAIRTNPEDTRRRRTIRLVRSNGRSWGFTLQTYGIRNKRTGKVEVMSYVDYVEINGPAWMAGMRRGDIILSVNGDSVEWSTHTDMVAKIQRCENELRLVVLFEDCCKKVELHERYLKLKKLLSLKLKELRELEEQERRLNKGVPLSRVDVFRKSTSSSTSSDWDIYSEITSPSAVATVPVNQFAFRENLDQSVSDLSTGSSNLDNSFSSSDFRDEGETQSLSSGQQGYHRRSVSGGTAEIASREDRANKSFSGSSSSSSDGDTRSLGQSDVSERQRNSDRGFHDLYTVTRCAEGIGHVSQCTSAAHRSRFLEVQRPWLPDRGSMTNLVMNCGSEVKGESSHQGEDRSALNERSHDHESQEGQVGGGKPCRFYMESDSEDSYVNGRARHQSYSSGHSISDVSSGHYGSDIISAYNVSVSDGASVQSLRGSVSDISSRHNASDVCSCHSISDVNSAHNISASASDIINISSNIRCSVRSDVSTCQETGNEDSARGNEGTATSSLETNGLPHGHLPCTVSCTRPLPQACGQSVEIGQATLQHSAHRLDTHGDNSIAQVQTSGPFLSVFTPASSKHLRPSTPHTVDPSDVSTKERDNLVDTPSTQTPVSMAGRKRLIHGILVNDCNYSTRL